ncbi:MAG: response regulator [Nanoarchaeota archaeon]|nr:response regulator [Nanoarchaeota archaeon]
MKILLVEDNPEFKKAAEEFFKTRNIEVDYVSDYKQAMQLLKINTYGGIITDCFFPAETGSEDRKLGYQVLEDLTKDTKISKDTPVSKAMIKVLDTLGAEGETRKKVGELLAKNAHLPNFFSAIGYKEAMRMAIQESASNQPLGVLIAEEARSRGLPFVIATSTYHHDHLTQVISTKYGRHLVDCDKDKPGQKASPTFWEKAYTTLEKLV